MKVVLSFWERGYSPENPLVGDRLTLNLFPTFKLLLLDSNQDYLLPESSVLAVTPRSKARGMRLLPGMTVLLLDHFTGPLNPVIPTVSTFSKKVHSRSGVF